MRIHPGTIVLLIALAGGGGSIGWMAVGMRAGAGDAAGAPDAIPVPVEVAPVRSGAIRDIRTLGGTLEAAARFVVAAKASGLLEEVRVDLSDEVQRGQVVALIEDQEFQQALAQAEAELAVRRAEVTRAETNLALARAEFDREERLRDEGISSASEFEGARALLDAASADLSVSRARLRQSEAAVQVARIRLDETRVRADWLGGEDVAIVGERHQDAGNTVAIGDPVVTAVTLDPLRAVVFVTERDYGKLGVGQHVELSTDAVPGRTFDAQIARISPVFRETSRQARVEIRVANPDRALRPGMFVRTRIVIESREAETIVPLTALARRGDREVVFVVDEDGSSVREVPVTSGVVEGQLVEIVEPDRLAPDGGGRVVTLGQHLLDDGSPVTIPAEDDA